MLHDLVDAVTIGQPDVAAQFKGSGDDTLKLDSVNSVLGFLISRRLILDSARDRGVKISASDKEQGKTQLLGQLAQDAASQQKVFSRLDPATADFLIEAEGAQLALQADFSKGVNPDAEAKKVFDANPAAYDQICLSSITVATAPLLATVQSRLANGEDFAAVAKDVSIDNGAANGGSLGCIATSQINDQQASADLAKADVGAVVGPYGQEGQRVLVKVDGRKPATFDEAKAAIVQGLVPAGQEKFSAFLDQAEKSSKIVVNPRYGKWDKSQRTVTPPPGPANPRASDNGKVATGTPAG